MSRFARFKPDPDNRFVPVTGWYRVRDEADPDGFDYPELPPSNELAWVPSAEIWADREGRSNGQTYAVDQGSFPAVVVKIKP